MSIFHAYDVRGICPTELNEKIAFDIGRAFGTFNPGKIVVGSDARLSGPAIKEQLIRGLLTTNADVVDIGRVTTPMVLFSTANYKFDGGIMVTASHNPKEDNGFKFYDKNALPISYELGLNKIEELVTNKKFAKGEGEFSKMNIEKDYINFLLKKIKLKNPINLKIVIDAGNGSSGIVNPKVLEKFGAKVYRLYCEPDGNFPNHHPDTSKKENLKDLQEKVREVGADLGFAYDGDGDRLAVVDENGDIIDTHKVFAFLIKNILTKKEKVVYDVLTSRMIYDAIKLYGGFPVVCRVGHTYLSRKMFEEKAVLGGELSGHYYFRETFGNDDAVFASLKILEFMVNKNKKPSNGVAELPVYISDSIRVPIETNKKFRFIENLKKELRESGHKIDDLDGVKVFFDKGWALFRSSNTEPVISIAYEATSEDEFNTIKKFVNNIIKCSEMML